MKKNWILITIIILLGLIFATTQVFASPAEYASLKKTQDHTPGAKATQHATERATRDHDRDSGARATERATRETGKQHNDRVNLRGTVSAVDSASLLITTDDNENISVAITSDTQIKIPSLGKSGTTADIQVGAKVNVHAIQDQAGNLSALTIMVVPGKPSQVHRVGNVVDYQPGASITIQANDSNAYSFRITEETKILPVERVDQLIIGARVTIICPRDVTGGEPTAKGIVVHSDSSEIPDEVTSAPQEDWDNTSIETPTATPTETPAIP